MFISFCSPCLGFLRLLKCMNEFCASEIVSTWYKHQLMNCLHRIDPLASPWGHFLDWYRRAPNTVGSAVPGQAAWGCVRKQTECRGEWAHKRAPFPGLMAPTVASLDDGLSPAGQMIPFLPQFLWVTACIKAIETQLGNDVFHYSGKFVVLFLLVQPFLFSPTIIYCHIFNNFSLSLLWILSLFCFILLLLVFHSILSSFL